MFSVVYPWLSFRIHLPSMESYLRSLTSLYVGNSADAALTLWFSDVPSEEIRATIDGYINDLTEAGEAAKFLLDQQRNDVVDRVQTALLTSDMTTWTPAERKLFMGMPLSNDDKDALLLKYPAA